MLFLMKQHLLIISIITLLLCQTEEILSSKPACYQWLVL